MKADSEKGSQSPMSQPRFEKSGLPYRTEIILKRERNLYPLMVDRLVGRLSKEQEVPGTRGLTLDELVSAIHRRDGLTLPAAAFIAGRFPTEDPAERQRLIDALGDVLASLVVEELDIMDRSYIQAAMSLALLGELEAGRRALQPLVGHHAGSTDESYLAAFYLAQMGDPSGYPVMLKALEGDDEHVRLMALRHLVGFQPYDGQQVAGKTVDVEAELIKRIRDDDPYVRAEVPYHLAEAGVGGLPDLLVPLAQRDPDKGVRLAARNVLDELEK